MKKILLIIFITMIFFPYEVLAKEKIVIECEENTLYNNQEIDCKIIADNFDYIVTSITGKIKTSDNLIITNSLYDDSKWMILDDVFNVEDINLISEFKEERKYFVIANFKLKAINKETSTGIVSFEEVIIGDEYYEEKEKTIENISEIEPSSAQFKKWMSKIDENIKDCKLIIVFDNMDRLPKVEVQELWAAIHSFFAEINYNNIVVIVPFDRNHIHTAFESENIDLEDGHSQLEGTSEQKQVCKKCYGDDFINKTFDVIYRVSPPIMSGWKNYFATRWKDAMGEELKEDSRILQIYDVSVENPTPREIIAFINEFEKMMNQAKRCLFWATPTKMLNYINNISE